jgi:hypothetical protein
MVPDIRDFLSSLLRAKAHADLDEDLKTLDKLLSSSMQLIKDDVRRAHRHFTDTKCLRKALDIAHQHLRYIAVDKAAGNIATVCVWHYCHMHLQRLNSEAFQKFEGNVDELLAGLLMETHDLLEGRQFLDEILSEAKFSGFYLTLKVIKLLRAGTTQEAKASLSMYRGVVQGFASPNTSIARLLVRADTPIRQVFIEHCDERSMEILQAQGKEVRFNFRSRDGVQPVLANLSEIVEPITSLWHFDAERMFETVPVAESRERSCDMFERSLQHRNARCLHVSATSSWHSWTSIHSKRQCKFGASSKCYCITPMFYRKLLEANDEMAYVQYNGTVYKQTFGIGIGNVHSSLRANTYVDMGDYHDVNNLVATCNWEMLDEYRHLYRQADDALAVNAPNLLTHLRVVELKQPDGSPYLILNQENESTSSVNFCDASIWIEHGKINFKLYDKASSMGAFSPQLHRYVHPASATPAHTMRGVVAGQLQRIYSVSQTEEYFIADATRLLLTIRSLGHSHKHTRQLLRAADKSPPTPWPYLSWTPSDRTWATLGQHLFRLQHIEQDCDPSYGSLILSGVHNVHITKYLECCHSCNRVPCHHYPNKAPPTDTNPAPPTGPNKRQHKG